MDCFANSVRIIEGAFDEFDIVAAGDLLGKFRRVSGVDCEFVTSSEGFCDEGDA